jgi:hypothetical protein
MTQQQLDLLQLATTLVAHATTKGVTFGRYGEKI